MSAMETLKTELVTQPPSAKRGTETTLVVVPVVTAYAAHSNLNAAILRQRTLLTLSLRALPRETAASKFVPVTTTSASSVWTSTRFKSPDPLPARTQSKLWVGLSTGWGRNTPKRLDV